MPKAPHQGATAPTLIEVTGHDLVAAEQQLMGIVDREIASISGFAENFARPHLAAITQTVFTEMKAAGFRVGKVAK